MAVERWTPERRRERTREALLDAATTVFAQRGFHGASLDEIAETAGYTRGAIYKHFADKEDLLLAVFTRTNERILAEFSEFAGANETFDLLDVHAIAMKWSDVMTRAELHALLLELQLYGLRNPEVRERLVAQSRANAQLIADFIEQHAAELGETLPMPAEDLAMIFGITSDAFSLAAHFNPDARRLYETFLDLFIRALRDSDAETSPRPS
ncbi:MAG: TetR/AcrR family transcriptional regulator [Actinomycetota bacterium]|nr:TetR/AcrR family transcriptional regulator [Actinomycetota bacterium]